MSAIELLEEAAGMTDIDWSKAPEGATHYNASGDHYPWERRHGDALSYVGHDGKWHELSEGGKFEWPEAIPRPAQHRDWSDPAMWFDAPEKVDQGRVDVETGVLFYWGFVCEELAVAHALVPGQQSDAYDTKDSALVACRPRQRVESTAQPAIGPDNVNHPSHYTQGNIECIDAIASATAGKNGIEAVCVANVVKYLWRYEEKNGAEDVKKAEWYLRKLLDHLNKS